MKLRLLFAAVIAVAVIGASAGGIGAASSNAVPRPYLVKDLNTAPIGSDPGGFTSANGHVIFEAQDAVGHERLWSTDGSASGTHILSKAIGGAWLQMASAGKYVYWVAQTASDQTELWRTDGTQAGTVRLIQTRPKAHWNVDPNSFAAVGSEMYFLEDNGQSGQLWVTNGSPAGTHKVTNILMRGGGTWLWHGDNVVYFEAYSPSAGSELWVSNGTPKGTFMLRDIRPGAAGSSPQPLGLLGSTFFFSASDGTHGTELWKTDGSRSGTVMVKDIAPGAAGSEPQQMTTGDGLAFFLACDRAASDAKCGQGGGNPNQLWKTDGTAAGTVEVKQFTNFEGPKYVGTNSSGSPIVLTVGRNKLWESDGTPAGTQPMPGGIYGDYVTPVVVGPHPLAFFVGLGTGGYQLWSTDGSAAGTRKLGAASPSFLTSATLAGKPGVIFAGGSSQTGNQPWFSDGTAPGTRLIKQIVTGTLGSPIDAITSAGGKAFFAMNYMPECIPSPRPRICPSQSQLYVSNGTAVGTLHLRDFHWAWSYAAVRSSLVFLTQDAKLGLQLWRSDGTASGTTKLAQLGPFRQNSAAQIYAAGRRAFVLVGPDQLWITDGSAGGTRKIATIANLATDGWMSAAVSNGNLYFAAKWSNSNCMATVPCSGYGLFRSDGTASGTRRVWAAPVKSSQNASTPQNIASAPWGALFETKTSAKSIWKVWSYSAKSHKTALIAKVTYENAEYPSFAPVGGRVFFTASGSGGTKPGGAELLSTNGTRKGTSVVAKIGAGHRSASIEHLTAAGSGIFFSADDGVRGNELWSARAFVPEAHMVRDIWPGMSSSNPQEFTAFDGKLYFSATDARHGTELWETSGIRRGTQLVDDIYPGSVSSWPYALTAAGSGLFFAATDPQHGEELWALHR